ncbi:ABC transporter substrate-binding protein [Enterococcus sp. LJL120]
MKNKWKLAVVGLLGVSLLSACGGSDSAGSSSSTSATTEDGATVLEYWTFTELHQEFFETMEEKWNDENPDNLISINAQVLPYEDMHNKLQIALSDNQGTPDFVDIEVGKFSNFTRGDNVGLMDLTDVAAPYREDIVESRMQLYTKDDHLYGLPTHVGTTVAFYNTELLAAADIDYATIETWADYQAAGEAYYEATGNYLGTADTGALWQLNLLTVQNGGDYVDEAGDLTIDSAAVKAGLDTIVELRDANATATVPGGNPDTEEAFGAFNDGEYATAIMPLWQMSRYLEYMPDLAGKIAIAPVPQVAAGDQVTVGGGGTGTAVIADKANSELAAEFIAYAKLSVEGNIEIWNQLGFDPCNMSVWEDETVTHNPDNKFVEYFANNPFDILNEMKDGIKGLHAETTPYYPLINTEFSSITLNDVLESGTDVSEALATAQDSVANQAD